MKRFAVAAIAAFVLAGCTSTVAGHGSGGGPGLPTDPTQPTQPTSPGPPASTTAGPAAATLDDPSSADLCAGVRLAAFRQLGTPIFEPAQLAAACYVTLLKRGAAYIGLNVVAKPASAAEPRVLGQEKTVAGLPVVRRPSDEFTCQRDIWLSSTVLSISGTSLGASVPRTALCQAADKLVAQEAAAVLAGVPRRPLASSSLVRRDMCGGVAAGDLSQIPGGAPIKPEHNYYGTFCRATNQAYTLGVEVVFRKAAAKPVRHSSVGGHSLVWFDASTSTSIACDVTSLQQRTADSAVIEAIDFYLIGRNGPLRGQRLCTTLATEAGRILTRLRLH